MKANDKIETVVRVGKIIEGDGWILPEGWYRPVTLACGHVKALNSKRRLAVGDRKLCEVCTHEDRVAGVYDVSRKVKKFQEFDVEAEKNFHVNPYEWHEVKE